MVAPYLKMGGGLSVDWMGEGETDHHCHRVLFETSTSGQKRHPKKAIHDFRYAFSHDKIRNL